MIIKNYRQILARIRRVFEMNFKRGAGGVAYDPAKAIPITHTVQLERRSASRRDGTCPWGIESRRNY
jgi:hypothetical protein